MPIKHVETFTIYLNLLLTLSCHYYISCSRSKYIFLFYFFCFIILMYARMALYVIICYVIISSNNKIVEKK